eukprot:7105220-Prymnesium_polylepis.1
MDEWMNCVFCMWQTLFTLVQLTMYSVGWQTPRSALTPRTHPGSAADFRRPSVGLPPSFRRPSAGLPSSFRRPSAGLPSSFRRPSVVLPPSFR